MTALRLTTIFTCTLALAACSRDRIVDRDRDRPLTDPGTTTITGANVASVGSDSAVTRIASARCAREVACNNIGANKSFANESACNQKIKVDMKDDLNAKDCPNGVDQKELDECLAEIRSESCNNPIDKIERLAACRTSDLCLSTHSTNR